MRKHFTDMILILITLSAANYYALSVWIGFPFSTAVFLLLAALFTVGNLQLPPQRALSKRLEYLESGSRLLRIFLFAAGLEIVFTGFFLGNAPHMRAGIVLTHIFIVLLFDGLLLWNGMFRVFLCSAQLGIKWRVLGVLCGWIPVLNLWILGRIIKITSQEASFEKEKLRFLTVQTENELCKTKYPLLLVHGVFFRDSKLLNYWGRIPAYLRRNGAEIYYGEHGSAASVETSGAELAGRIREITEQTGCGKVNLIAHSKGGLDCRAAITRAGAASLVASLTTISTPHRGCLFADYLLKNIPPKVQRFLARKYNNAAKRLGDTDPDFLEAVGSLTAAACAQFNRQTPDAPEVSYRSAGSGMRRPKGGKFPLNLTHRFVRQFDGQNDGLVAVDSMKWGERFTCAGGEGCNVSHADVIDLTRKNIDGFDVREFYVSLVQDLKARGF